MFTAEAFFEKSDATDPKREHAAAAALAISKEAQTISGIVYTTYAFPDHSKLTIGSNGYIGCELPGLPHGHPYS
jgi:hypothetical protein